MIIWGSTGKEKIVAQGNFFCPNCGGDSPFAQVRIARYFTLYFIPLFRTATLGEFVHCRRCSGQFKTSILSIPPAQLQAMLQPWQCEECGNNNPASSATCLGCQAPRPMESMPQGPAS